jgi:outer membrane receptor for ferrienterochelin and colicins
LETNVDLGVKLNVGKKATALLGLNYFRYNQKLITITITLLMLLFLTEFPFSKWTFDEEKIDCLPLRRVAFMKIVWGDVRWEKKHRGGDEIYGESIYTKRAVDWKLPTAFQE